MCNRFKVALMISIRFNLEQVGGEAPSGFTGFVTRASFLQLVKEADPALSTLLHGGYDATKRMRSFYSLKPLEYSASKQKAWFEVNFKLSEVARSTLESLLKATKKQLMIGSAEFLIESLSVKELEPRTLSQTLEQELESADSLDLRFKTPTYFSTKSNFKVILPNLLLMFMNAENDMYIARYASIPRKHVFNLRRKLGFTGVQVKSEIVRDGKKLYPGFTGWVKVRWKELEQNERSTLCLLLAWGVLFNVGSGRTAGFGVLQVEPCKKAIYK
ncbi:hypothetical protein B9Q13_03735 [Candidatus Marsarchaeota G2 archaeon ECH_B_SAG-G16]|uniref:CRISPR-associated protein Cas6 C-terminal domain-containing protein n=1 Tax=Candidatus Marsarchaeota G2 archaeon ECH_B_SAG-G16 TaxID=1978167 RepID=A0A2R6C1H1_9ARCH|nr:MAG: hypothetical protein B9Q13_03735 [Candidatus Marsarchaeota G2 archaeon ECH_B_SAG-G16]